MNIQTERIDNHQARITVEIEPKRWQKAKKEAARGLSRRYKIPGFRKGKAPYNVIKRYVGEAPIIEEAMEKMGNEVYREALESSDVDPYALGNLENFQLEPQPTYVFTIPLVPEVEPGDYRSMRVDYEEPEVTDEDVNNAMRRLQQQEALVEEKEGPIAEGDRVTLDLHSEFADGKERDDDEEFDPNDLNEAPKKGDHFLHRHDIEMNLDRDLEPVMPGFMDELLGAEVDDELEFELTIPDDDADYDERILGRKIRFEVTVKEVQAVILPEMNDDFAARVTEEDNDKPLTLLELRMRVRENMQAQVRQEYNDLYKNKVLGKLIEGAVRIDFPEAMLQDRIDDRLKQLAGQLREQNMTLEMYQKKEGITGEELREQQRDEAIEGLKRSLVLGQVLQAENISVSDEEVEGHIDEMLAQFGERANALRNFLDTPQQRQNIVSNVMSEKIMERLVKIAKGEPLDEEDDDTDDADAIEAEAEIVDADAVAETDDESADAQTDEEATDDTEADGTLDEEAIETAAADNASDTVMDEEPAATKSDD